MGKVIKKIIWICIICIASYGCNRQKQGLTDSQINYLITNVWNFVWPDSIFKAHHTEREYFLSKAYFKNNPLFFLDKKVFFRCTHSELGKYYFSNDTLLIIDRYLTSGIDSMRHVADTVFIGKVTKLSTDSLVFSVIKGNPFRWPISNENYSKRLVFYNDLVLLKKKTTFKTLSLSSRFDIGPSLAIELDGNGNLHCYRQIKGEKAYYYKGRYDITKLDSIRHLLTAALVNQESIKLFANGNYRGVELKVILENNDTLSVNGDYFQFNYRLLNVYRTLAKSIFSEKWEKDAKSFKFLANTYIIDN